MSIKNANSSCIDVFPLSIDRVFSNDTTYYIINEVKFKEYYEAATPENKKNLMRFYRAIDKESSIDSFTNDILKDAGFPEGTTATDVFTSSATGSYYNGRVLSEQHLTLIGSKICSLPSFITNYNTYITQGGTEEYDSIEFILGGYYFKLRREKDTDDLLDFSNLYVGIKLTSDETPFRRLCVYDARESEDPTNFLYGVDFSTEPLSTSSYDATLKLLESSTIPIASIQRFTSHTIKNINGGTI